MARSDVYKRQSPQSTSEYADIGIASVLNYVNLRAEPSVESEALGKPVSYTHLYELVGEVTNIRYKLGQRVHVMVTGTDKILRTIDFRVVRENEEE